MKADWILDYDYVTDKCYKRPGCPECQAPVGMHGKCFSCGKEYELDGFMLGWLEDNLAIKTEIQDCFKCGGKGCVLMAYGKNPVTGEWMAAGSHCEKCGTKIIV